MWEKRASCPTSRNERSRRSYGIMLDVGSDGILSQSESLWLTEKPGR